VTETAATGTAAITALRTRTPNFVLLNLNMPGTLDGRAVLRAIGQESPVIVVTSISDVEDARAQLQAEIRTVGVNSHRTGTITRLRSSRLVV
jgi:CheY-like chemotaxis protein